MDRSEGLFRIHLHGTGFRSEASCFKTAPLRQAFSPAGTKQEKLRCRGIKRTVASQQTLHVVSHKLPRSRAGTRACLAPQSFPDPTRAVDSLFGSCSTDAR